MADAITLSGGEGEIVTEYFGIENATDPAHAAELQASIVAEPQAELQESESDTSAEVDDMTDFEFGMNVDVDTENDENHNSRETEPAEQSEYTDAELAEHVWWSFGKKEKVFDEPALHAKGYKTAEIAQIVAMLSKCYERDTRLPGGYRVTQPQAGCWKLQK